MKRCISLIVISMMILSALMLAACGGGSSEDLSDSKYVGTWRASSVSVVGETGDIEDESILTINGDGTGTLAGDGEESSFTWEPTDDGFKTKGDVKLTFKDDGDNIKADVLGIELVFERQ